MDIKCIGLVFSVMRLIARNASLFAKPGAFPDAHLFRPTRTLSYWYRSMRLLALLGTRADPTRSHGSHYSASVR